MPFHTYIVTNKYQGPLYIGMTNNLPRRTLEHREKKIDGFCKKYNLTRLVYAEEYITAYEAITREKQLKNWKRQWKIELIESINPQWQDYFKILT